MDTNIISILSSPTLAKRFSCVGCQSTSYPGCYFFVLRKEIDTYTNDGGMSSEDVDRFNRCIAFHVGINIPSDVHEILKGKELQIRRTHQRQTVISSDAPNTCPAFVGLQASPYLYSLLALSLPRYKRCHELTPLSAVRSTLYPAYTLHLSPARSNASFYQIQIPHPKPPSSQSNQDSGACTVPY